MGAAFDKSVAAQIYRALTHDELVARLVIRDESLRIAMAQLEEARRKVGELERKVAIGRNRI